MDKNNLGETIQYDSQNRLKKVRLGPTLTGASVYDSYGRMTAKTANGNVTDTQWLTYLTGPTGVYAVVMTKSGTDQVFYVLKDNLGSWTTITDEHGNVAQQLSYDAWGNLRNPNTWSGSFSGTPLFDRGFTGHEHLYNFGLINMNGRMYDPVMSSFLSADRYVQDPTSAQGFNRYAYCMYNPLRFVDPTGWAPRPGGGGNGPDIPPPYVVIDGWASGYKLDEVTITAAPLFNYEFVYTPYYNSGGGGDLQLGLGDNSQPKGHISGGGGGNHGGTIQNQNDNLEIASKVLISANVYTSIISKKYYNPYSKTWMDKNGTIRSFDFNGNGSTGGKSSFGKMMSNKYLKASGWLNIVGMSLSIVELSSTDCLDEKIKYGSDIVIGAIGFAPGGNIISVFWFFGGRELVFLNGEIMGSMIKDGINPGLMEYQPFK